MMPGVKRHMRIRKFVIEMNRALKLEEGGDYVTMRTDESYIHQNHSSSTSGVKANGNSFCNTTSKGKRLFIPHAITRDG